VGCELVAAHEACILAAEPILSHEVGDPSRFITLCNVIVGEEGLSVGTRFVLFWLEGHTRLNENWVGVELFFVDRVHQEQFVSEELFLEISIAANHY
jgi:hypothetical protein